MQARACCCFEVRTQALATRLLLERAARHGWRAVGVEARTPEVQQTLRTARGVVLAAGAIGTPQLLQLSGVGPPALLQRHGIEPRHALLSTDEDRRVAAQSLRLTRRIAAQPALARFKPRELKPGAQFDSDAELPRPAGDIGTTILHPVGTCRMGRDGNALAVLDARLRVRGIDGLVVADASAMPAITSGNTSAPTLMIAERAAHWLVDMPRKT
jgi:choline dehydrogenase-like flavoprotein